MTNHEIADALTELVQLDVDAVLAYDRAIGGLGEGQVSTALAGFRLDHQRHILELSKQLLEMGHTPPPAAPDVKGTILGGVTALRSRLGADQALRSMRDNEQLTTSTYARMLAKPFPDDVLELVRRNYSDEQRHLAWIERALDGRAWEQDVGAHI